MRPGLGGSARAIGSTGLEAGFGIIGGREVVLGVGFARAIGAEICYRVAQAVAGSFRDPGSGSRCDGWTFHDSRPFDDCRAHTGAGPFSGCRTVGGDVRCRDGLADLDGWFETGGQVLFHGDGRGARARCGDRRRRSGFGRRRRRGPGFGGRKLDWGGWRPRVCGCLHHRCVNSRLAVRVSPSPTPS